MKWKRWLRMLFIDPNSAEGLRIRIEVLREKGVTDDNPLITAYKKILHEKEYEERGIK